MLIALSMDAAPLQSGSSLYIAIGLSSSPWDVLVFVLSLFASVFYMPWRVERPITRKPRVTQSLITLNILIFVITVGIANMHLPQDRVEGQRLLERWRAAYGDDFEKIALHQTRDANGYRQLWQMEHAYADYVFTPHYSTLNVFAYRPSETAPVLKMVGLLGSMFLHGSVMHLFGNMLFLWVFGRALEDELSGRFYLVVYLMAGICGTLLYQLTTIRFMPEAVGIPTMGASGAIAGLLGAFALRLHNVRVHVFCVPPMSWPIVVFLSGLATGATYFILGPMAARVASLIIIGGLFWFGPGLFWMIYDMASVWAMAAWLVLFNILPGAWSALTGQANGVAHWAHIGGFLAGLGCVLVYRPQVQVLYPQDATTALANNDFQQAIRHADQLLKYNPSDTDALTVKAIALDRQHSDRRALTLYAAAITRHLEEASYKKAAQVYITARERHPDFILAADAQYILGREMMNHCDWQNAAETLAEIFFAYPASLKAEESLLASVHIYLYRLHEPRLAAALLHILLQYYPETQWLDHARYLLNIAQGAHALAYAEEIAYLH